MPTSQSTRYVDVLALPQVRVTFSAALVGRAAYTMVFLPLLYAVSDATGSIALAGTAVALYGATASFLAPARAWLIDRFGTRLVLAVLVLLFGLTLSTLAAASLLGASGASLIFLAAVAGAVAPPLGPTMRVAWGKLTPNAALLRKGLSLDAVVEDLLYLIGPAITGVGLTFISPGAALIVPAVLVIMGGVLFVLTPTINSLAPSGAETSTKSHGRPLILSAQFVGLLLPVLVTGTIASTLSVAVPFALTNNGGPAAAGIALGLFAGGSAVGGLLFGAMNVPGSPSRQLTALPTALLAISSLVAFTPGPVGISVVLFFSGLFFSPVMIVAYIAAHTAGGEHRQNSATTWVNTSHNLGTSVGSALAGILLQTGGVLTAIVGTAAVALLLLVIGMVMSRTGESTMR